MSSLLYNKFLFFSAKYIASFVCDLSTRKSLYFCKILENIQYNLKISSSTYQYKKSAG